MRIFMCVYVTVQTALSCAELPRKNLRTRAYNDVDIQICILTYMCACVCAYVYYTNSLQAVCQPMGRAAKQDYGRMRTPSYMHKHAYTGIPCIICFWHSDFQHAYYDMSDLCIYISTYMFIHLF